MFKDYYAILEVQFDCSQDEIKKAFKEQAKRWHPDRNTDIDTTIKMQDVNEAYLILGDIDARLRYDEQYEKYKSFSLNAEKKHYDSTNNKGFEYDDEILKRWVKNAREQAIEYVKHTLIEVGQLSVSATKAASAKMIELIITYSLFGFVIILLMKACGAF